MARYSLLFFDLDGTLANTSNDIAIGVELALRDIGLPPVPRHRIIASIGSGARKLIERCLPTESEQTHTRVLDRFIIQYRAHLLDTSALYPGVDATLRALHEPLKAVVSNKPEDLSRELLHRLSISQHFVAIFGGDTLPARKPDPSAIEIVRQRHHREKRECLFIGDSGVDAETARAAGIDFCAVTYGYHQPGELDTVTIRIDHFADLLPIVLG